MDFTEECQQLSFDDSKWIVLKYDEETVYLDRIAKLQETKGVDFIGIHASDLYLIEVKDFRNFRIQTQPRLTSGELAIEVGQKVRDTVAGIVGAYRTSSDPQKWELFAKKLIANNKVIRIVIWLEYDLPTHNTARDKVRASVETNIYKKRLNWLTSQVLVTNQTNNNIPNLSVSNLPHP
jgi:hypothetical protein